MPWSWIILRGKVFRRRGSTRDRRESVEEKQYDGFKTGPADLFAQVSHTRLWHHTPLCIFFLVVKKGGLWGAGNDFHNCLPLHGSNGKLQSKSRSTDMHQIDMHYEVVMGQLQLIVTRTTP